MKTNRYNLFINNLAQDLLLLGFFILIISVYRILFIYIFKTNLTDGFFSHEVYLALWYGFRLSLKTVSALCIPTFIFCTLLSQIFRCYNSYRVRFFYGAFCVFVLSLLFQSRIPYYQEFNVAFSPFIFNTFHDDVGAITKTAISQYNAIWRVLLAIIISGVFIFALRYWLKLHTFIAAPFLKIKQKFIVVLSIVILLFPFALFMRFGGSFNFKHSIYWKNSARLQTPLLNEAILDDIQALYKARKIYRNLKKNSAKITAEEVKKSISLLSGKETETNSLLPFFTKKAQGILAKKPSHIFVIVGETYMLWPLLEKYNNLPIAEGGRRLKEKYDNVFLTKFLPASHGTMFGLTSVLMGLPEVNLTTASRQTAQKPYEIALSVQLKKLGYTPHFFYGGFPSWENVGKFMTNQGLEENFYSASFSGKDTNVWGVEDKIFFEGILSKITDEPSFNLILTSSNHTPYIIDMSKENVHQENYFAPFLEKQTDKKLYLQRLQNFEYADHYLADFVERVLAKFPDSLIVITGDHADRWTLTTTPTLQERIAVPLLIISKGLKQEMLPQNTTASHQDIAATVLDLVLPKGLEYFALGKSIFDGQDLAVGAYYWATSDYIGEINSNTYEKLNSSASDLTDEEIQQIHNRVKAYHNIASWRILKGTEL